MLREKRRGNDLFSSLLIAVFLLSAVSMGVSAQTLPAAKAREILTQARRSYYSLKEDGFSGMRCEVDPDWEAAFASVKVDSLKSMEIFPFLKTIHFELLVGPDGSSLLSRDFDSPPPSENIATRIRSVTNGFDEVVTGFFHTWSQFMMDSILPDPDSQYTLAQTGGEYHLSYSDTKTEVSATMSRDYSITAIHVKTAAFESTLSPKFTTTSRGWILSSYEATFQAGPQAGEQLSVTIEYPSVDGLRLPKDVAVVVTQPSQTVHVPFALSDCRLKTR